MRRLVTTETGHGREEVRSYFQMPVPTDLAEAERWKGLRTIGLVVSTRIREGKETTKLRYCPAEPSRSKYTDRSIRLPTRNFGFLGQRAPNCSAAETASMRNEPQAVLP